jgi:hypothetical protein
VAEFGDGSEFLRMVKRRTKRTGARSRDLEVAGWREWVRLPELNVGPMKAKLDTGARSSSLHAFALEAFRRDGREWLRFSVHPIQRDSVTTVEAEAELVDHRVVRNSGGHSELRPVIRTELALGDKRWPIELTLTRRDEMGFRMLLGRQAIRGHFAVDAGKSFRLSRPLKGAAGSPKKRLPTKKKRTRPKKMAGDL